MTLKSNPTPSRRDLLVSFASAGAAALAPAGALGQVEPTLSTQARKDATAKLMSYFASTAPKLLRPAEGVFAHPSIAPSLPGKQYSAELWDWDTLWTTRGLFRYANLAGDRELHAKIGEHARGSLLNFLDHQSDEGRLPILMNAKNADILGSLKPASPNKNNQAKPVMAQLALLTGEEIQDVSWLNPHFEKLLAFYDSWTRNNQSASGLLVWGDDVAIGNDNDPTTFGRPFFSSANLLLNCLFYQDLRAASTLARQLNRTEDHQRLMVQAKRLGDRVRELCWDPRDRFFYTVDVQCVDRRAELIPGIAQGMDMSWQTLPLRIQTFTGFLPLWCGLAEPSQANELVHANYLADKRFRADSGVRSLSNLESMYSLAFSSNPSNWLGPVWIVVNYFVWKGLKNYGFDDAAAELRDKTLRMLAADLAANGSMNEYYHPDTGAPLSHKGFMDWNMLVLEML